MKILFTIVVLIFCYWNTIEFAFANNGWLDLGVPCDYTHINNADSHSAMNDLLFTGTYYKPQGKSTLCLLQTVDIFNEQQYGNGIVSYKTCPTRPPNQIDVRLTNLVSYPNASYPDPYNIFSYCYTNTQSHRTSSDPSDCSSSYSPDEVCVGGTASGSDPCWGGTMSQPADVCDAYYELYTSTWTDIAPGYYTVATVNGVTVGPANRKVLYTDSYYGYDKNLWCNPTSGDYPRAPVLTTKLYHLKSETYWWDAIPPSSVRAGEYASFPNGPYLSDAAKAQKILDMQANSTDITLTYIGDTDNNPNNDIIYTGAWTNSGVQGWGICSDPDSGCSTYNIGDTPPFIKSAPLHHKQASFNYDIITATGLIIDKVNNSTGMLFDSTVRNIISVDRKCYYQLSTEKIDAYMSPTANPATGYNSSQSATLLAIKAAITANSFNPSYIQTLLAMKGDINTGTSPLFDGPSNCKYTPSFGPGIPPLIDRIKPTIQVTARIGSGSISPDILLKQEGATPGVPATFVTGSYLAGTGTITVTIVDSGASTFTDSTVWNNYNGISGMKFITIDVCRTKTHTGFVLNSDCFRYSPSVTHIIHQSGGIIDPQYNIGGTITTPHILTYTMDIDDINPDGIQVTGEYQVYTALIDMAGNTNTGIALFNIYPEGFDDTRTRLDKYTDLTLETQAETVYTTTGANAPIPGGTLNVPVFANAQDAHAYKLTIFDKYSNPIPNWKLYGFGLTATGVFLDQVNRAQTGALFINASGGILTNLLQTGTTDGNGSLKFTILSYTPGEYKEQYKFSYKNWDRWYVETGLLNPMITYPSGITLTGTFDHILTGSLQLYKTNRIDLGTANAILMDFRTTSVTSIPTFTGFTVSNFLESIESMDLTYYRVTNRGLYNSGFVFTGVTVPYYYPNPSYLTGSTGSFTLQQNGTEFKDEVKVKAYPYITYSLSGLTTKYYVSDKQAVFGSGLQYGGKTDHPTIVDFDVTGVTKTGAIAVCNIKDLDGVTGTCTITGGPGATSWNIGSNRNLDNLSPATTYTLTLAGTAKSIDINGNTTIDTINKSMSFTTMSTTSTDNPTIITLSINLLSSGLISILCNITDVDGATGNCSLGTTSKSIQSGYMIFNGLTPDTDYTINLVGLARNNDTGTDTLINRSLPFKTPTDAIITPASYLNRIYIEGLKSIVGKDGYINSKENIYVANSSEMRNSVHKNVGLILRNRTAAAGGGIINRIKYMTGDVNSSSLTDLASWDVLIIKGGNLTIGANYSSSADRTEVETIPRHYFFNTGVTNDLNSIAHKGIIVLKDETTGSGGSIYIRPDVRFIGASLFADESIESVDYNGNIFTTSDSDRTKYLNKQLVFYGSIFSKNTTGGAILGNTTDYFLPWGEKTSSLDTAIRYDLAFLRMENSGSVSVSYLNGGHDEYNIVVLTDPRNFTKPLPGFVQK